MTNNGAGDRITDLEARIHDLEQENEALRREVAERRRATEALVVSERDLRLIVDTIPAIAGLMGPDGRWEVGNYQAMEYVGRPMEEVRDWQASGVNHPDDVPRITELFARAMATGSIYENEQRIRRHDDVYRWFKVRALPVRNSEGQITRWNVACTDIEDSKQLADAIATSERNLRLTIDTIPALAWSARADGVVDFFNRHYLDYVGLTAGQIGDQRWTSFIHPDDLDVAERAWQRFSTDAAGGEVEARLRRHDGVYRWFLLRTAPMRDEADHVTRWYGVNTDIEDRKALDTVRSELEHVARVSALGELTASITHEINQPLSGILTNASICLRMLSRDSPDIDGARETARRTLRDGDRATQVVTRLRSLFRKREFSVEIVNLNDAAQEVISLSALDLQRRNISIRGQFDKTLPMARGDRVQLQQVIINLILNAADALEGVADRLREIVVETSNPSAVIVQLTVRDRGCGIAPEALGRMFETFYTTKPDGMGIGLSVSRSILERHEGKLWASLNDDGPGSAVSFSIPVAPLSG